MPLTVKRVYQFLYLSYVLFLGIIYIIFPSVVENSDGFVNVVFVSLIITTLTFMITYFETKFQTLKVYWLLGYFISILSPILFLFTKYANIICLLTIIPFLLVAFISKRTKIVKYNVLNDKLINIDYLLCFLVSVILILTKQEYWYLGILMLLNVVVIEALVYLDLKKVSKNNDTRILVTLLMIILIAFLAYNGELLLDYRSNISVLENVLIPIVTIASVMVLAVVNKRNLDELIKNITID